MNRWLTILLFFCCVSFSMAQERFIPSRPPNDAAKYEGPIYGIKGGGSFSWLQYTNPQLRRMEPDFVVKKAMGIFYEIPVYTTYTVAIEAYYQERGGSFSYRFANQYNEQYRLDATYLSLRIPVYYYLPITDRLKPYVFLAGEAGVPFKGNISLSHSGNYPSEIPQNQSTAINSYNINLIHAGVVGGIGMRWNIPLSVITLVVKVDAAFNYGLTDTFSKQELSGASTSTNIHAYSIHGHRYLRGIELNLGLGFFFNKYDSCSTFQ